MESEISKSDTQFVQNYKIAQQGLSLKDSESDREEAAKSFSQTFLSKIEGIAYLFTENTLR